MLSILKKKKSVYSHKCSFILAWFNAMKYIMNRFKTLQTQVARQ